MSGQANVVESLFADLWRDYSALNPLAYRVRDLFIAQGEEVLNDHVAFRTFNHPTVDLDRFLKIFAQLGYVQGGKYHFKEKKLYAIHLEPADTKLPKVFISQLLTEQLSARAQAIIHGLIAQIPHLYAEREDFIYSGRPWAVSFSQYQELVQESEYAAWMAAFGFRVNHFTVSVNHLRKYTTIAQVNQFLKSHGYQINSSGGEIKGSPEVYLEQSSTLANKVSVQFSDGEFAIPSVYYEFALRYRLPTGQLYQGFVEKSADKIFESTDARLQKNPGSKV